MFVTLKDGTLKCITTETDVADIVEEYCGTELAEVIRKSNYKKIVDNCAEAEELLEEMYEDLVLFVNDTLITNMEKVLDLLHRNVEDSW